MSISNLLSVGRNRKYATSFRRSTAAIIDIWITLFVRALFAQIAGFIFMNHQMNKFILDFKTEFGTDAPKNVPEHVDFIIHHPFFYYLIIFYALILMIGASYHAYFNSSPWSGTIGKRLMKIMINTENELPITFNRALLHYFLSVLPFAFLFYLLVYQISHNLNLYQAITASQLNLFLGIGFVFWVQIQIFTKKRVTAYDMIANTVMLNGRTAYKWPWKPRVKPRVKPSNTSK